MAKISHNKNKCKCCLKSKVSKGESICSSCQLRLDDIDRRAEDIQAIRREMRRYGVGVRKYTNKDFEEQ